MIADAIIGAQFGSEGKGLIAGHLAGNYDGSLRVGAANAGHTLYTKMDPSPFDNRVEKHVMQQIPCQAYARPSSDLYIGPGALISPEIFAHELETWHGWLREHGLETGQVFVDHRAHVITIDQMDREQKTDLAERIGSTSTIAREGIGVAQSDRVMRTAECVTAADFYDDPEYFGKVVIVDVPRVLHGTESDYRVLLEGTQGTGLSLTTGFFPYTTSRNTTAAGLCADAGVAPRDLDRVIAVARTYPIRVAGNSGPFYSDSEEIGWDDIYVDPESERTTVTKKVRRVATFSMQQLKDAVMLNGATEIALTFCDYLCPEIEGMAGDWSSIPESIRDNILWKLGRLIVDIECETNTPVTMLGTGPHSVIERRF